MKRIVRLTTSELTSILVALAFLTLVFSVVLTQGTGAR